MKIAIPKDEQNQGRQSGQNIGNDGDDSASRNQTSRDLLCL